MNQKRITRQKWKVQRQQQQPLLFIIRIWREVMVLNPAPARREREPYDLPLITRISIWIQKNFNNWQISPAKPGEL